MTTDDLPPGLPAATRSRGLVRVACCLLLALASLPVCAAPPEATPPEPIAPSRAALFGSDINALLAAPAPLPAAPPEPSGRIQGILSTALTLLGTKYRWGGMSPEVGFDCSGLVGYVFRTTLGIELPRVSRDMAGRGEAVKDRAELSPGDLVFFNLRGRIDHVGIYLGEGRFLHAPRKGEDVRVDSLGSGYWSGRFVQGRRVAL